MDELESYPLFFKRRSALDKAAIFPGGFYQPPGFKHLLALHWI